MPAPRPLRIIHITATATGAPWMVAFLREQKKLGHEVAAIVPSLDGGIAAALAVEGIPCYAATVDILPIPSLFGRARAISRLVCLLRRLRPDVIHSHIFNAVITARIAAWIADVPIRFSGSVGPLSMESELLRPMDAGTAFCDTKTIASCQYTRELFLRYGVPPEQVELVYYAVDQSGHDPALTDGARVRRELGLDADTPVVGKVAYFYPPSNSPGLFPPPLLGRGMKGHDVLLRAVPHVLAEIPEARFVLVGRGWGPTGPQYERELKELAESLGISHAVLFPGERSDVADTLAAFDVSVHCSLTDNLAGTVESLLMAKPMVVSDIPGFADTVLHEETGLVVPADDPPALAASIVRLLRDRELGARLGENGRRFMLSRFTLARSIADLEELMARSPQRAEAHYRIPTMLARAITAPFRLYPIVRQVQRVLGQAGGPLRKRLLWRAKGLVRNALKRPAGPRRGSGRVRIAQVAGAWENCQWFVDVCRDLAARGYDVIAIIDAVPGDLGTRLEAAGIRHYEVPMTFATARDRSRLPVYAMRIPLAALRIARILRRERIDLVHSHIFASVVVARIAAALARTPHVSMAPGPRHLEAPLTRTADRLTWWLDDVTIAGCHYTHDLYRSLGANRERLDCIYYGVEPGRFDPSKADPAAARLALGLAESTPLVALVAHFYAPTRGAQTPPRTMGLGVKGHHDFLDAARLIARHLPSARFVLAGDGVMEAGEAYRQRLIAECQGDELLRDRVLFTGRHDDVPSLLAAADVAVQCSLVENLGGTIEALLMERPVVATRAGGMPESVRDGETGLLVPPSDPEALAAAILRLLENREEGAALGRAGRRLMLERFTFARMVDDIDAVYGRLSRGAAAGAAS
jgi:glycosyltransferase involved in cell wall biosynthesis